MVSICHCAAINEQPEMHLFIIVMLPLLRVQPYHGQSVQVVDRLGDRGGKHDYIWGHSAARDHCGVEGALECRGEIGQSEQLIQLQV